MLKILFKFSPTISLILISIRKMKEVGIIRAIGAPKSKIIRIMIHLGIKKAVRGSATGLVIALLVVFIQNTFLLIPLPSKIYFIDHLPMKLKLIDFLLVSIMVSTFIFISSFFAAKKVSDLKLTEALQWMK